MCKEMDQIYQEGAVQGRKEGRAEGRAEERTATARKMLADGLPIDVIRKYTELSEEEIKKLEH